MANSPRDPRSSGLSRRGFLTGTGAAAAAAAGLLPPSPAEAAVETTQAASASAFGPGPVALDLLVNGKKVSTKVEPRVTLLDALRNYLDVTGCKRVCDRGTCGACTVMLDGKPVYSCSMLALEARGREIKTAEGLVGPDGKLDAVPASFSDCDAQQCGFCTPGFIVSLKAALEKNPKATPADLEHAVAGNICRCGTYEQMRCSIEQLCKKGG
jgi:xanthine dehydrogenase YagT iron-sulfur-binding subunit